ncbi:hypothetical protein [Streptomyces sp. WAC06614]|nr:hypothetical protein [Streptomyces sp. WAC06614]
MPPDVGAGAGAGVAEAAMDTVPAEDGGGLARYRMTTAQVLRPA